jgi:hypothetical protein
MDGRELIVLADGSKAGACDWPLVFDGMPCDWSGVSDGTSPHWPVAHITKHSFQAPLTFSNAPVFVHSPGAFLYCHKIRN